jgi:hypothetical protein
MLSGDPAGNSSRSFQSGIELARSQDEPAKKKRRIREQHMIRLRAADDFETIRARMEELRRERAYTLPTSKDTRVVAKTPRTFDDGRVDPLRRPDPFDD